MKYLISATPGPMPPTPEQFDAAIEWLEGKVDDGTFDCVYGTSRAAASASRTPIPIAMPLT